MGNIRGCASDAVASVKIVQRMLSATMLYFLSFYL